MDTQELLQAGIQAVKAGDKAQAAGMLARVVQMDPTSEDGWFWLGLSLNEKEKKEFCFQRVLALNPNRSEARRELTRLHQPAKVQPFTSSPFTDETPRQEPLHSIPPASAKPIRKLEPRPAPAPIPQPQQQAAPVEKPARKKIPWWAIAIAMVLCLAFVGTGIVLAPRLLPAQPALTPIAPLTTILTPSPMPGLMSYTPVFESAPCFVQIPEGVKVDCGFVVLPENRSSDVSDTIRLAVVIYRSTSQAPAPDPVIYLQGGPGAYALSWGEANYESVIKRFLQSRDFVIFDPRGVGKSEPALECKEFANTYLQDLEGKIPADQRKSYYQGALQTCRVNLTKEGANLSAYHSSASADDVADVISALGYKQANLYAISYGTRVAQLVLKNHPDKVRSAILDSVVPLGKSTASDKTSNHGQALQTLFAECAADQACASAYPDLDKMVAETVARLDATPIMLDVGRPDNSTFAQPVTGATFKSAIVWSQWSTYSMPFTPQLIYRTYKEDYSYLQYLLSFPAFSYEDFSLGVYITVNCLEQVLPSMPGEMDEVVIELCEQWTGTSTAIEETDLPVSDAPALILSGNFDPTTPSRYASQLASRMSRSFFFEFPTYGHAPTSADQTGCASTMMQAFVQDPLTAPDASCMTEDKPVEFWMPYTGKPPVSLERRLLGNSGLHTFVPTDWADIGYGFFTRNATPVDVTQFAVQQSPTNEPDWITWLTTQFNGKKGFDSPLISNGTRQANGLIWNLYQTTSSGYPVDMAFAKTGNQTFMVLIMSYPEERDANFNTIFLPALEGTQ